MHATRSILTMQDTQGQKLGRFAEMIGALTAALDLAEGNAEGHTLRTCIIAMRIGRRLSLAPPALSDLYYAALLKDIAGTQTQTYDMNATGQGGFRARRLLREGRQAMPLRETAGALLDLFQGKPLVQRTVSTLRFLVGRNSLRAETAALRSAASNDLLSRLGVSPQTRTAIACIDERWDGQGFAAGYRGAQTPLLAQIVKLSQTMEYFREQGGPRAVVRWLHRRCRGWFDPGLVAAATRLFESPSCWWQLEQKDLLAYTISLEPREHLLTANGATTDRICEVFATVIDARSPYSNAHSHTVAEIAVRIARQLRLPDRQVQSLRRAALLHTLGTLTIQRHVLENDGPLSDNDRHILRTYPLRTFAVLQRVPEFQELAQIAMSPHERLDGSGYPHGSTAEQLSLPARILAVADVAEALAAERSYRRPYSAQQIHQILSSMTPHALDHQCVNALLYVNVVSRVA